MKFKVYQCLSCEDIVKQIIKDDKSKDFNYRAERPLSDYKVKHAIEAGFLKPHKLSDCYSCNRPNYSYEHDFEGL